jgi:PAS domain S-box-containing protein
MSGDSVSDHTTDTSLRYGEARFRAVFDGAAIGIALVDSAGRPVQCNHALEDILGYTESELSGMTFPDFTHPDDVQADLDLYQQLVAGKRSYYEIEKRYQRKDGQIVWGHLTVSRVHSQGDRPQLMIGMVEDVTSRKTAEEALRESEEKFFKAFHGNPNPILITRRSDGRMIEVNEAFCQWFGISPNEARKMTAFDFKFWNSDKDRNEFLAALQKQGLVRNYRKTVTLPSGEERITHLSVQLITLRGEECLLTISDDVTQQIRAEEALKRSEERLRRGLEAARMGIWEWNVQTNQITWTEEVYSLFGLKAGEFGGTLESFLKLVGDDDRRRVHHEIEDTLNGTNRKYYSEMPIRRPDGSMRWLESRGELKRDAEGKPLMMLGTVTDVTDRKRAERALRSSEESLRATIENTPDVAVQWYDEQGKVIFWNRASENIFGWTAGEAHGKTLDKLILNNEETERFAKAIKEVQRTGRPERPTEYHFHRRDRSDGFCVSTLFRIPSDDKSFCFVCMDVDITPRKKAEESLREMQQRELRSREDFTRALLEAEEQERQRLAAELHDSLGQNLSIITNKAYLALKQPNLPPMVVEHLNAISQAASETIAEVRRLVLNLRPLQIEQLGLTDSIRELVEKIARSTSMRLEYRVEDIDDAIRGNAATHLYRIVQEALNNLLKHSGAERGSFSLERDVHCIRIRLQDNGRGFDVQRALVGRGFGLKSISERAQMLGGRLEVKSKPGTGTELVVELPILEQHGQES